MTRMGRRLDRLVARRPVVAASAEVRFDLSRLTDDELVRVQRLRTRLEAVGVEGLTPDELMEAAAVRALLDRSTAL